MCVLLAVLVRVFVVDRLWPETRSQQLLDDAALALSEGRLSAADGSGARQLYEAAQVLDPDDARARAGLADVARAAAAQARDAVADGRLVQARSALALARELSAPRDAVEPVAAALRAREIAGAGLDRVLADARRAFAAGHLDGADDAALPLFQRVLALRPDDPDALRGREDALAQLLDQARARLREGELGSAAALIAQVRHYDPGHVDLPDTEARMSEELDALQARASRSLAGGHLERAVAQWRALQALDPDNAAARRGLLDAGVAYAQRGERLARDFRFADADAQLLQARALAPDSEAVRVAVERVAQSRANHARMAPRLPPAERRARVEQLLRQAAAAEARGALLEPPGDSAFDKLRAARRIAPDDAGVAEATARLLPAAQACFDTSLQANSLGRARTCLDVRETLGEAGPALREARRRLAQRWLAIGDERLGGGNLQGASAALAAARDLDPGVSGLEALDERVRAASLGEN